MSLPAAALTRKQYDLLKRLSQNPDEPYVGNAHAQAAQRRTLYALQDAKLITFRVLPGGQWQYPLTDAGRAFLEAR